MTAMTGMPGVTAGRGGETALALGLGTARGRRAEPPVTVGPAPDPANATATGQARLLAAFEHRTPGMSAIGRKDVDDDHQ